MMPWRNPEFWHAVPFIGLMVKPPNGVISGSLITRLLEAAVIGGVVMWGTVQVLGTDIDWLKKQVSEINYKQDARIERLENWLLVPRDKP